MCVQTLRTGLIFPRRLIWGVTCLGLLKIWTLFPSVSMKTPENVCWNPENRAHFSKTIDLRGHMPRITQKWMFSHLSPSKPQNVCSNPENRAHFSKTIDLKVTCLGLLKNECFPIYLLGNLWINVCQTLRTGLIFSKMINLRGSHA